MPPAALEDLVPAPAEPPTIKSAIPIRTFAQWDDHRHGFVEVDLVSHDGGNASGDFAQTLTLTDLATGWTENRAVQNKAQRWAFEALRAIQVTLPFALPGLESDNGWISSTRTCWPTAPQSRSSFHPGRPYRKNDGGYVK